MTEKQLLTLIRNTCRWAHLLCYHTFDSQRSEPGFPDLVVVGDRGILYRELKSACGRLTAEQRVWIDRLTEVGGRRWRVETVRLARARSS